ncbi:MAG: MFS transporter, partial [Thermoplasmata archaeon]|nr:MFS transporter [Thermoplasmata archaeon]
ALSAYTADLVQGSERTVGFTWQRIGYNAGFAAGVAIGGSLIALLGFAGAAGVSALVLLGGATLLTIRLDPSPRDLRPVEGRVGTAEVGPPTLQGWRGSVRALATDRAFLLVTLAFTLTELVVIQWAVTFPLFVHDRLGVGYSSLGIALALNGIIVVVGQAPMTQRVLGWRHSTLGIVGIGLYTIAFLGLGLAGLWDLAPFAAVLVAVVVLTLGENLESIPNSVLPSNLAPASERGAYNGAFNSINAVGVAIALVYGGWALGAFANPLLLWIVLVAPGIPAVLLLRFAAGSMRPDVDRA